MKIGAAREELAQYIRTTVYECPGWQWRGYIERHYSDVDGPVTSRTYHPGYGQDLHRVSLQLCLQGVEEPGGYGMVAAYAAQVNWSKHVRGLLSREPDWRDVSAPLSYDTPEAVTRAARGAGSRHLAVKGEELGVRFARALRATGKGWERDVVRDWRLTPKRRRKAVAV